MLKGFCESWGCWSCFLSDRENCCLDDIASSCKVIRHNEPAQSQVMRCSTEFSDIESQAGKHQTPITRNDLVTLKGRCNLVLTDLLHPDFNLRSHLGSCLTRWKGSGNFESSIAHFRGTLVCCRCGAGDRSARSTAFVAFNLQKNLYTLSRLSAFSIHFCVIVQGRSFSGL